MTIIFFSIFSLNVFAFDHSFEVHDTDGDGGERQSTFYTNNGDPYISGEVRDEYGDVHSFQGRWNGVGKISGVTDDGDPIELNVN